MKVKQTGTNEIQKKNRPGILEEAEETVLLFAVFMLAGAWQMTAFAASEAEQER